MTQSKNYIEAYTDYPIERLGDKLYKPAPVRSCKIIGYDGNKYAKIRVGRYVETIKLGYCYKENGRSGEVKIFMHDEVCKFFNIEE